MTSTCLGFITHSSGLSFEGDTEDAIFFGFGDGSTGEIDYEGKWGNLSAAEFQLAVVPIVSDLKRVRCSSFGCICFPIRVQLPARKNSILPTTASVEALPSVRLVVVLYLCIPRPYS